MQRERKSVYVCGKLTICGYRDCLWVRQNVEGETGLCVWKERWVDLEENSGGVWKKTGEGLVVSGERDGVCEDICRGRVFECV